jgi:NitT/TauT family transport system permease protein
MAERHYKHHYHFSYLTSKKLHLSSAVIVISIITAILLVIFKYLNPESSLDLNQISVSTIILASINTLFRLFAAYFFSFIIAVPLALLITKSEKIEKILLPIADIVQSVPVLAFFPIVVIAFIKINFLEGAVIFILWLDMLWSLVFSMIGGLKTIPQDILDAAKIYNVKGFNKLRFITIPAIFPYIITGSLLSWAQGWGILMVAEAIHSYIPHGSTNNDPIGLGSLLVDSFYKGQNLVFIASLISMIVLITIMNLFIWQKLLRISERFKFD